MIDHENGIVIQPTCVDGSIVLEIKCLLHPDDLIGLLNTRMENAWWPSLRRMVLKHLEDVTLY